MSNFFCLHNFKIFALYHSIVFSIPFSNEVSGDQLKFSSENFPSTLFSFVPSGLEVSNTNSPFQPIVFAIIKAIVPSEGLVFKYKGKTYKFTGAFAPVNQIMGLITY